VCDDVVVSYDDHKKAGGNVTVSYVAKTTNDSVMDDIKVSKKPTSAPVAQKNEEQSGAGEGEMKGAWQSMFSALESKEQEPEDIAEEMMKRASNTVLLSSYLQTFFNAGREVIKRRLRILPPILGQLELTAAEIARMYTRPTCDAAAM
jgi:hypothetical protein